MLPENPYNSVCLRQLMALAPQLAGRDATQARGYGVPMNFLTAVRYPVHDRDWMRDTLRRLREATQCGGRLR